jgi:hypothetical protein
VKTWAAEVTTTNLRVNLFSPRGQDGMRAQAMPAKTLAAPRPRPSPRSSQTCVNLHFFERETLHHEP